jgi:hypothetical protein
MIDPKLVNVPDGKLEACRTMKCSLLTEMFGQVVCGARFGVQSGIPAPFGELAKASDAGCTTARAIYEPRVEAMRK